MSTEGNGKTNWLLIIGGLSLLAAVIGQWWAANQEELRHVAELAAFRASTEARFVEIETQFRAQDQINNIHLADEKRSLSILWPKVFGEPYPSEVYYPQIAK